MTPVIKVSMLSKTFGARRVLDQIGFEVAPGERVALIGPSGAGKSTLLRQLVGLSHPDRGSPARVEVLGRALSRAGRVRRGSRAERLRTGYIFQQFNLAGRLNVLTNVLIGRLGAMPRMRALCGWFCADERRMALDALARVGIDHLAGQRANTLSGGQMQRVAIARALVQDAELILADEPIASLDPRAAREVMEILERVSREDGRTLLVSLHQVDYARRHCERAIALKDGRLYFDGPIGELTDDRLESLYDNLALDAIGVERDARRRALDVPGGMLGATG
ncbi:phosphonate ABC transporter ATP-binding protein [Halotalea alkalilenta]|uniref:Phosphonate ABC transporter ATP-binding protein n=1 Tax=Halotalea alkalilenta TaxID=376489 RepID=A0A172YEF9_9GAMM|nr:phosphonate ABC transporter ATP-binding protein [Halotalea alkalilenta]ANF57355.1 phosphonate ABC transporter ATP-binding protein [Halotalea alkalilenta]